MKRLPAVNRDRANVYTSALFEEIEKSFGMLPNIYTVIGNSSNALASYREFSEAQKYGSFSAREREAVFLSASEENKCGYCIAAHTAIAKSIGFTDEDILKLRTGMYADRKLNTLTNVAKVIIRNKGNVDDSLISVFYEAGFDEKALVDLVALIAVITFSNYIGRLSNPEIDFPVPQEILEKVSS